MNSILFNPALDIDICICSKGKNGREHLENVDLFLYIIFLYSFRYLKVTISFSLAC